MRSTESGGSAILWIAATVIAAGLPGEAASVSGGYLAAVQAELDEVNSGRFYLPAGSLWTRETQSLANLSISSPEFREFEKLLKSKAPGTFIQFQRLHPSKRMDLYRTYVADGDLSNVRRAILDTLN
jgi:hypothetical protein